MNGLRKFVFAIMSVAIIAVSCGDTVLTEKTTDGWLINRDELYSRGVGKGGIFSLDLPRLELARRATYLHDNDRIIGIIIDGQARAFPLNILRWHEIVNDMVDDEFFSVIYGPFTATGMVWRREYNGDSTSYGVSDLVYNGSHILFDRASDSYWVPMMQKCVYGIRVNEDSPDIRFIETTWRTWTDMYPESFVVSRNTIYNYDYDDDPYPQYSADNEMLFYPITHYDNRLPRKEKVHAVIADNFASAYRISMLPDSVHAMNEIFAGEPIVVAGSNMNNFVISFSRRLDDDTVLTFAAIQDSLPAVFRDNEGTVWDVFGNAISGPRTGESLAMLDSYNCYWFALASIFPDVEIIEP